jgi:pimeloyl-ACP methyl ester carboxylesterase
LVLISPASHPWAGGVAWYYRLGAHPLLGPLFRRVLAAPIGALRMGGIVASVFAPNAPPADFAQRTRVPLVLRPLHFRAYSEDVVALFDAVSRLSPRYSEIASPVEIITGEDDTVVSPDIHAKALEREIPGARLTVLSGVGHSPHHSAPEAVVGIVREAARRAEARETAPA